MMKLNQICKLAFLGILFTTGLFINRKWIESALASPLELEANKVCTKGGTAVVTVKHDKGHGSGFIISKDGLIITNAHVLAKSPRVVTVIFKNGKLASADVIGFAKNGVDLAAIKIHNWTNLSHLHLATSEVPRVGYRVFAIGTPLDVKYQNTCTQGNISSIHTDGTIQHTATLNPGNSGGPLLNSEGKVIGINTAVATSTVPMGSIELRIPAGTGINLSQPIEKLKLFLGDLYQKTASNVPTMIEEEGKIVDISLEGKIINANLNGVPDFYRFVGEKYQKVLVQMNSKSINPFLYLLYCNKNTTQCKKIADNDDRGPGDFNARINIELPEKGTYIIVASADKGGETGTYTLQVNANSH